MDPNDPIFSPTGKAGAKTTPVTPTIISSANIPAPAASPAPDPNHTTSTATGDIILQKSPSANQTKSKLPLIVGLAGAILAVGAGLFVLIANPFASNSPTSGSTVTSFNKFMNYLYDGSDATGYNEDAYVDNVTYKFSELLDSDNTENKTTYFATARQLFGSVDHSSFPDDEDITAMFAQVGTDLEFLSDLASTNELTGTYIMDYYTKTSAQRTKQYIQSHYDSLTRSSNSTTKQYAQNVSAYQVWLVDYLTYLAENKCINNDSVDSACVAELQIPEDVATTRDNLESSFAESSSLRYVVAARIISNLQQVATNLNIGATS